MIDHPETRPSNPKRLNRMLAGSIFLLLLATGLLVHFSGKGKPGFPSRLPGSGGFTTAEIAGKGVTVYRVDIRKDRLQLFHHNDKGLPFKRLEHLAEWLQESGRRLTFAMNAGMYHPDLSAVGLFVADGKQATPLNTSGGYGNFFLKPNGVFVLTESGVQILETSEYQDINSRIIFATQSGPLLVRSGEIHPALNPDSKSRLIRNGVGVTSSNVAVFAISEDPVNFHEFATLFRDILHCPNALFFDGVVSSLYAPSLQRADSREDLGPMIGVTE